MYFDFNNSLYLCIICRSKLNAWACSCSHRFLINRGLYYCFVISILMTSSTSSYEKLLDEMRKYAESRERNVQTLKSAKPLGEDRLRALDSTLKKVTAFTKKLKTIGSASATQFMPELDRLNLSKYLDEIAANICEAKLKTSDLEPLVQFCVRLAGLYADFPSQLVQEMRKQMPTKKGDRVTNASKLRVDLRFFAELLLNGVFDREGMQLLGTVLSFLVQTDRQEHVNVSVLLPFCRSALPAITGIVPASVVAAAAAQQKQIEREQFLSTIFSEEQRNAVAKLLTDYWDSLLEHTNKCRLEMNKLRKSIKRQERTRGDAPAEERQRFDQAKQCFDRLLQSAVELGECLGQSVPEMAEEPSDDERPGGGGEAASRRLDKEMSEGRVQLWPDRDSQLFYEGLLDVTAYTPTAAAQAADAAEQQQQQQHQKESQLINESIDNVDLSCLDEQPQQAAENEPAEADDEEEDLSLALDETAQQQQEEHEALRQRHSSSPAAAIGDFPPQGSTTANFHELLDRLPQCINRELIDAAAIDFLKHYARSKANRKRLIQHFCHPPADRLDLLPFYARFIATVRPAYPDIMQVLRELLTQFRAITQRNVDQEEAKKSEKKKVWSRIEHKLQMCAYLSELCKFGILPKAEALTCLRSLLVQMRSYKVDMLCVLVEQAGPFLYRSPDSHAKMAVIMQVLRTKSANIQDARQKILLENAYFTVIPPEDQPMSGFMPARRPPMQEFIMHKLATEIRVGIFRRIDWDDEELREFTLQLLASPWRVHFDDLARLASLVSALSDHHDWIGVRVLDDVLEFLRLSLELNLPAMQQKALSAAAYLGQLFNYNVSNTATLFKVLYQLISLGIQPPLPHSGLQADQLCVRLQRCRLICQLVDTVCEFFCTAGKSKKRMDHFLCFFLRFYYETRDSWSQFVEELDEFPEDVAQAVADLLKTWRKSEQFPTSLNEAQDKVAEIEQLYKAKVDELLAGMRYAMESKEADAEDAHRRLNRIVEEEEVGLMDELDDEEDEDSSFDDEEEDDEGGGGRHQRHHKKQDSMEQPPTTPSGTAAGDQSLQQPAANFEEADQQIRVHTQQQQIQPEDEDFMRDFDRLMVESMQSAPLTLHGPTSDLTVPPQAKQKFERKLTFATAESAGQSSNAVIEDENARHLLPTSSQNRPLQQSLAINQKQQQQPRMALMLRTSGGKSGAGAGKSQVLLKPVRIDQSENLAEKWRQAKEEQERDRREMKKVTLAMNERMTLEAEEQHRQQQLADMERKFVFAPSNNWGGGTADGDS